MGNIEQYLGVFKSGLDLRTYRHQVIASNIANADTPNYKSRDFDFSTAMSDAMAGRSGGVEMARTAEGHLGGGLGQMPNLLYRSEVQSAVDGNTVDMDLERSQLTENAMQYEVLAQFVSKRLQGLKAAAVGNSS